MGFDRARASSLHGSNALNHRYHSGTALGAMQDSGGMSNALAISGGVCTAIISRPPLSASTDSVSRSEWAT